MNDKNIIPLYLFAKAPVPGAVKTRMQPHITPLQSAELATMMLVQSVETVCRFWPGKLILTVTPNADHPAFCRLAKTHQFEVEVQVPGNLGDRMFHTLAQGIKYHDKAVVMGCDVPQISGESLQCVHQLLLENKNVIGPASDGGFYLLGLTRVDPVYFDGVQWGGNRVFSRVCKNLEDHGVELHKIPELRDIDNWEDLILLSDQDQRYHGFVI